MNSPAKPPTKSTDETPPAAADFISLDPDAANATDEASLKRRADSSTPSSAVSARSEDNQPPLPVGEQPPPLPNEPVPRQLAEEDDGWEPVWDENVQAFYFHNRLTQVTQWENPRVPDNNQKTVDPIDKGPPGATDVPVVVKRSVAGGYDPAIHGDYDPDADYAKAYKMNSTQAADGLVEGTDPAQTYAATGAFNRFTGKWQSTEINPENFNDENKSKRQMNAFFDVDAAANSHDGRSLKAERSGKKLSKKELKAFKEKRREKKEEKRRAWLRD